MAGKPDSVATQALVGTEPMTRQKQAMIRERTDTMSAWFNYIYLSGKSIVDMSK